MGEKAEKHYPLNIAFQIPQVILGSVEKPESPDTKKNNRKLLMENINYEVFIIKKNILLMEIVAAASPAWPSFPTLFVIREERVFFIIIIIILDMIKLMTIVSFFVLCINFINEEKFDLRDESNEKLRFYSKGKKEKNETEYEKAKQ